MNSKKKKEPAAPVFVEAPIEGAASTAVVEQPAAPSLDDPALVAAIAEQEPATAVVTEQPAAPSDDVPAGVELPATIQPRTLRLTLDALAESYQFFDSIPAAQRDLLAEVWARPLDDLYQRLWRLHGADPETMGPWGQALSVTAALMLPRLLPKITRAIGARFRPQDQPAQ